jgi:hypothetical protein
MINICRPKDLKLKDVESSITRLNSFLVDKCGMVEKSDAVNVTFLPALILRIMREEEAGSLWLDIACAHFERKLNIKVGLGLGSRFATTFFFEKKTNFPHMFSCSGHCLFEFGRVQSGGNKEEAQGD